MQDIAEKIIAARRMLITLLVALLATGCASVSNTREVSSAEPLGDGHEMSRAEQVFLYQSYIANALLDRYPLIEILENADPSVTEAEARMTESCGPLTQAALASFAGDEPSLGLRFRVIATIDACERAARKVDGLLNDTALADAL